MRWPEKCCLLAGAALAAPATAAASETVTYSYDALGRLVAVSTSGGPNDGAAVSTGYDPAGNRTSYGVTGADSAAAGAPAVAEDAEGGIGAAAPPGDLSGDEPRVLDEPESEAPDGEPPAEEEPEGDR